MLQAFVVTLREGLEAFLIVAISLAYLRKTGRQGLIPAVRWGILASIALSVGAGILFARASNQAGLVMSEDSLALTLAEYRALAPGDQRAVERQLSALDYSVGVD